MTFILFFCFPAEMEMNPAYTQQQAPPNQTAPWPNRMMAMDHYGNQSRYENIKEAIKTSRAQM